MNIKERLGEATAKELNEVLRATRYAEDVAICDRAVEDQELRMAVKRELCNRYNYVGDL